MADLHPGTRPVIVFDLGGVLVDWNPHYLYDRFFPGDPQAVDRFLKEVDFFAWNEVQDAGRPFAEAVAEQCALYPAYADLIRAYDMHYEESIAGPFPQTVAVLRALRQAGYPLYALSNWPLEKFIQVRHKYDFFECFDHILVSGEVRLIKPDPRIFAVLLERIGRQASECIFIDDAARNIAAANALGFQTVQFKSAEQLKGELAKLGVMIE